MAREWSFGEKVGLGFTGMLVLTAVVAVLSIVVARSLSSRMDTVLSVNARRAVLAEAMESAAERKASTGRGFLLNPHEIHIEGMRTAREECLAQLKSLQGLDPGDSTLAAIRRKEEEHQGAMERLITLRRKEARPERMGERFDAEVRPLMVELRQLTSRYSDQQAVQMDAARRASAEYAAGMRNVVIAITGAAFLLAGAATVWLTRLLKRQIGSAVQHIQSSSAELQTAANQQASGSKEHATSMNEITVTIQELLATARQIADSAKRVARIAQDTAGSAKTGGQTLQKAQDAVGIIQRQVDQIVLHMTDLGRKSQQIGGILELINELAEQTNILAINATIEASGAGESGKRFGAVADEIRKLADRVGGSTKEIRGLIEEIRAAVHTTVMATESGSKAVDAGTRQFTEVASVFNQISTLVGTTTEAALEIELSTKQQSTAVEQVNVAASNVAQAAQESEASAVQTVQTAADLAALSRQLARLVQRQATA